MIRERLRPTLTWMGSELQERLLGESMFHPSISCVYINLLIVSGFAEVAERELQWLKDQDVAAAFHADKFGGIRNLAATSDRDIRSGVEKLSLWVPEYIFAHPLECKGLNAVPCDIQSILDRGF